MVDAAAGGLVQRAWSGSAASSSPGRCRASSAGATCRRTSTARPTSAAYSWVEAEQAWLPFALDVLTLEGDRIKEITSFISRAALSREPEYYERFPEQPRDLDSAAAFERFGLPSRLD